MIEKHSVELGQLMKAYKITVDHSLNPQKWPSTRATRFRDIQQTWQDSFDTFERSVSGRYEQEPWRLETAKRAAKITDLAARARDERRNEAGWRILLENEFLERFIAKETW